MDKMVSFLILAMVAVATFPHADATINCYVCAGYLSDLPDDAVDNNPHCPQNNFDSKNITKMKGDVCTANYVEYGGKSFTQRFGTSSTKKVKDMMTRTGNKETFIGYVCDDDLCNDQNPSASTTLTFHLPLLLLSVVVVLSRSLA